MVLQFNQFMYEMKLKKKSGNNFNTFYKPGIDCQRPKQPYCHAATFTTSSTVIPLDLPFMSRTAMLLTSPLAELPCCQLYHFYAAMLLTLPLSCCHAANFTETTNIWIHAENDN